MKASQGEWKAQSWGNCWYNLDPVGKKTFGCTCQDVINLGIYPEVHVGEAFEDVYHLHGERSYALLYEQKLFHKHSQSLEKILEVALREFDLTDILAKLKNGELVSKTEEEKVIDRALAGCRHCKFYKLR